MKTPLSLHHTILLFTILNDYGKGLTGLSNSHHHNEYPVPIEIYDDIITINR